jgi:hypothetical protein
MEKPMRPRKLRVVAVALALGGLVLGGLPVAEAPAAPDCVDVWGEARYRNYGYDHIVHLANRCSEAVECDVWTDVNPNRTRVAVSAGARAEVLTFRGSPSREFTANAECGMVL